MNATALLLLAPLAVGNPPANCAPCNSGPMFTPMVQGYPPFPQPCPPIGPPAPVLAAKVLVPAGVVIGITGGAKGYSSGAQFGFRPGYRYRISLSNIAGQPGLTLYPQIEILGSLVPRNGLNYLEFPATFAFSEREIRQAAAGSLVTKVIYLEDPTKAIPSASTVDQPLEVAEASAEEAWQVASDNGRIVAVIKLGDRTPEAKELVGIGNTVLLPGDRNLGPAAGAALFHWTGVPLFDPILGPKPTTEECLTDGGDKKAILGIGPNGKLAGLDVTDVSAEYTQGAKRKVTTSNEVCICSPRFVARTAELMPGGLRATRHLGTEFGAKGYSAWAQRLAGQAILVRDRSAEIDARIRAGVTLNLTQLASFMDATRAAAVATSQGTLIVVSAIESEEITSHPDQLIVTKSVEPKGAVKVGDMVTITLKYENRTKQPVTDLVLSDNLSARLEYIQGSAKADRPTNVTTAANEAGSVVIRFEVPGAIQPSQGGVVSFQVKIR